jgi:hypothetical protein
MATQSLRLTSWAKIKERVMALHPKLCTALNDIPHVDDFRVMTVQYPFGAEILKDGVFQLNLDCEVMPHDDERIPLEIKNHLNYPWQVLPVSMVLTHSFDSFIPTPSHIMPYQMLGPGEILSLLTIFDRKDAYGIFQSTHCATAGCRSLFTLPKISDATYNQKLKHAYNVNEHTCPKTYTDQWALFHELATAEKFHDGWYCELLIFPRRFFEVIRETPELRSLLLQEVWGFTAFSRNLSSYDILWSCYIEKAVDSAARHHPGIIETVKHLIKIALLEVPGFAPTIDDTAGPVTKLMDTLINTYKIRYHMPIFMELSQYDGRHPVYYSLHRHTFAHSFQSQHSFQHTRQELIEIKHILEDFRDHVLGNKLPFDLEGSSLATMFSTTDFDFFHPQGEGELRSDIDMIATDDPRFTELMAQFPCKRTLKFPSSAAFFHGCIRISARAGGVLETQKYNRNL